MSGEDRFNMMLVIFILFCFAVYYELNYIPLVWAMICTVTFPLSIYMASTNWRRIHENSEFLFDFYVCIALVILTIGALAWASFRGRIGWYETDEEG